MPSHSISLQARRRTGRRYVVLLFVIFAVVAGWIVLWKYAAGRAGRAITEWRAHEAAAGRIFACADENIAGFPFRLEVTCRDARAEFRDFQPALDLAVPRVLTVAQIYDPNRLISEFDGPLQLSEAGRPAEFEATWSLGQASVSGLLAQPNRVSVVFDAPVLNHLTEGRRDAVFTARHFEVHGRPAQEGSTPGIEAGLRFEQALIPVWPAAAAQPFDAVIDTVMRGVTDFTPKPWLVRLRELQAAGGAFEIKQARIVQGDILAVGNGTLRFNGAGHLDGQLRLTVAGLEILLERIGAKQMVQSSTAMDKIAGALDRLAPGLGNVARQQVGENIAPGINALGEQTTLEGRKAVSLPLRFDNGAVFLGPIPLGQMPAGL
jgi:hypothetical protein